MTAGYNGCHRRSRREPHTPDRAAGERRRLPVSYPDGTLPVAGGWDEIPGSYLAFGDTNARERDDARARGWPVRTVPGEHLHQLANPDQVATELIDLVGRLGIKSPTR
jgi:hypothetical protein